MTNHIDIVVSDPMAPRSRESTTGDPLVDPRSSHSPLELHKRGVRGAFLFEGGGTGFMAGTLQAVYHHASGYPEWERFIKDPRTDWLALPREAQAQLLALDVSAADPQLEVSLADVSEVPSDSWLYPAHGTSFVDQKTYEHHVISQDLVGFLWVLQQYETSTGNPLKLVREGQGSNV